MRDLEKIARRHIEEENRKKRVVIVTGTPAAGKTTVAKKIARKIKAEYIDVNKLIKKHKLSVGYDRKRKSSIIDVDRLNGVLRNLIINAKKDLVIDSHLSHHLDKRLVDICIVAKCDIDVLKKRLEKRGYHKSKVRENLDVEIFDVCLMEALALGHKVDVVDTSKGLRGWELKEKKR